MSEKNIRQEFRLTNTNETRNYFIKEINQNELMSKKHKKVCRVLNYIEHLLFGIPIGIASSAAGLKICVITAEIKKYKSMIKKKKKRHDKILLAKSKLNSMEVLISKALTDSNISHNDFVSINNVLKKFYDMKEKIKTSNDK